MRGLKLRQLSAAFFILCLITVTGTILFSVQRGVFFPFKWTADYLQEDHGITIDAGSHGTRAHLYRWAGRVEDPSHPLQSPVTIPEEIATIAPPEAGGVSEYLDTPTLVGDRVLKPLIEGLKLKLTEIKVPESDWKSIRLYLKATAGMRNADVDARDALMDSVRQWIRANSPFDFIDPWARVISGEEEGTFGWISVNNLAGTLLSPANGTIGALDLGGASLQITFMPTHTSVLEDYYELQLGPNPLRLYSHSFLGYGWEDSLSRLTARLALETLFDLLSANPALLELPVEKRNVPKEVAAGDFPHISVDSRKEDPAGASAVAVVTAKHPCFPKGYKYTYDLPDAVYPDGRSFLDLDMRAVLAYMAASGIDLLSPSVQRHVPSTLLDAVLLHPLEQSADLESIDFRERRFRGLHINATTTERSEGPQPFRPWASSLPEPKLRYKFHFRGSGEFYQCQTRAKLLFYREPCFLNTCSFNGIYQPRIAESEFLALGQFSKVRNALEIPPAATPDTLEKAAAKVCQTAWDEILQQHEDGAYSPYGKSGVAKLCWKALWAHVTLTHGFGLDGESKAVSFWNPPDGDFENPPGWALGSMVAEISYYPWQNALGRFAAPYWWALSAMVSLVILVQIQQKRINNHRNKLSMLRVNRSDIYDDLAE